MKKSFKKFQPQSINYRSYKHFSNDTCRKDLIYKLSNEKFVINDDGLKRFCELSVNVLNKHVPRKKKYARGNQMPFFTKELSKGIMTRSRLRNKYLKNRNEENRAIYNFSWQHKTCKAKTYKANSKFDLKIKETLHINWRKPNLNAQRDHLALTLSL